MGNSNNCVSVATDCLCLPIAEQKIDDRSLVEEQDIFSVDEYPVEIYLELKQEELGMHCFPADRLRLSWRSIYAIFDDYGDIGEDQFVTILTHCKLMQQASPVGNG